MPDTAMWEPCREMVKEQIFERFSPGTAYTENMTRLFPLLAGLLLFPVDVYKRQVQTVFTNIRQGFGKCGGVLHQAHRTRRRKIHAVSYTHLDVYKRQRLRSRHLTGAPGLNIFSPLLCFGLMSHFFYPALDIPSRFNYLFPTFPIGI